MCLMVVTFEGRIRPLGLNTLPAPHLLPSADKLEAPVQGVNHPTASCRLGLSLLQTEKPLDPS